MRTKVEIPSDGLKLAGVLDIPENYVAGTRRPAVIVLHGFGGNKDGVTHVAEADFYRRLGYVVLRMDMRGCGDSEGIRGRILCHDQVADTRNALTWLAAREEVLPRAVLVSGQSFGGAIALCAGAVDERFAAVVSIGGWGNGERKFRGQHASPEAWRQFSALLDAGRRARQEGRLMTISRWDIVPVPEEKRKNLPAGAIMDFPVESALSMHDFKAEEVVAFISPRPLLIAHGAADSVTPNEQALELFRRAGKGAELLVLSGMDHFPFVDENLRLQRHLEGWLCQYFPPKVY